MKRFRLIYISWIFLAWAPAFAQFENVMVKLQSGSEVPLVDLPWFKLALNISQSQYKNRATNADWLIVSSPQYCPTMNGYRVQWEGSISGFKQQTIDACSRRAKGLLSGLPSDIAKVCECKVVLEGIAVPRGTKAVWTSLDDEILVSEELKLKRTLVGPNGEMPVMLSVGGQTSGIYDFKGNQLCVYDGRVKNSSQNSGIIAQIENILRISDRPIPVSCFGSMSADMDLSKVSYSAFQSKVVGDIFLNFKNGEKYVIKPD